jgi:sulfite exporter TauE/SafE
MTAALAAGLVLGAVGSGHCVVMCGPLVLALARGGPLRGLRYHTGRLLTYAAFGAVAGQAGYRLAMTGLGRPLAILAGIVLLATAFGWLPLGNAPGFRAWTALTARAGSAAGRWSLRHRVAGPLVAGAANGLLPCGLVYAAITAATGFGGSATAAVFMTGFGAGTLPVLAALSFSASRAPHVVQGLVRRATPVVLSGIAALLILRGLGAMPAVVSACHGHFH